MSKTFRVTVVRHYISVQTVDVEADRPQDARRMAQTAVHSTFPDSRHTATDNGWHGEDPVEVPHVGYWAHSDKHGPHLTRPIGKKHKVHLFIDEC